MKSWKRALKRMSRKTRALGFEIVRAYPDSGIRLEGLLTNEAKAASSSTRLISFSLYGTHETYLTGAIENALQYPDLFPGWSLVFFVGDSVPRRVIDELQERSGVQIIRMAGQSEDSSAMLWRYLPAGWDTTEAVLFRDADCRPSLRERAAVDEWLASTRSVHAMRDHPNHHEAIMGGMWGVRGPVLRDIGTLIDDYGVDAKFSGDQRFLRSAVYPAVAHDLLVHQDWMIYPDTSDVEVRPFPVDRRGEGFVGQGLTDEGEIRPGHDFIEP